ncbi:hypothetical protein LEM8419_00685 [Neolewinella maritima]|uniref:Transporter n=2 Tax=Neolewinella maritima TaxID=1383882 RepID=A0ABM9AXE4_9BACT|nr:hypothetical protein LEM8419_00685 [Neolewinella maritima]
MRFLWLLLSMCTVLPLAGQTDSLPQTGPQLSYALSLYNPLGAADDYRGASLDAEARLHRNFSLLLSLGRLEREEVTSWAGLPLQRLANVPLPPNWPSERLNDVVIQQTLRVYVGLGGQLNLRVGSGDLALSGLLTVGPTRLRQLATYGRLILPTQAGSNPPEVLPPSGLSGTATLRYLAPVQLGAVVQLHYTHWLSRHLALRIGTGLFNHGLATWNTYRDGEPARYELREIDYQGAHRIGVENYPLPEEESIPTPDPTAHERHVLAFNVGMIYKPAKSIR